MKRNFVKLAKCGSAEGISQLLVGNSAAVVPLLQEPFAIFNEWASNNDERAFADLIEQTVK